MLTEQKRQNFSIGAQMGWTHTVEVMYKSHMKGLVMDNNVFWLLFNEAFCHILDLNTL